MWATYFPVYIYWLFLSAKARSFFFFTATNPGIETGGWLGESKKGILEKIPNEYKPTSLFIPKEKNLGEVLAIMKQAKVQFPIVAKPDVGERGTLVERLDDEMALEKHLLKNKIDFIIQPFVTYPIELAIMFYRMPNEEKSKVISITKKKFLSITGNGKNTVKELIMDYPRAVLQYDKLEKRFGDLFNNVLPKGETMELEQIGNHCRGTMFLNGNDLIDRELTDVISKIVIQLDEIYFGRFDMKCQSIEELKAGKHISILEINGVGAEPAHIYDPNFPLMKVYSTLLNQWKIMYEIAMYNHKKRSIPFMSFNEMWVWWKNLNAYHAGLDKSY